MKKLLLSLAAFAAVTTISAQELAPVANTASVADTKCVTIAPVEIQKVAKTATEFTPKALRVAPSANQSSNESTTIRPQDFGFETGMWEPLGTGKFVDDVISSLFGVENITVDVEIETDLSTEGKYRLVDPYKAIAEEFGFDYDTSAKHYLVVHAEDPDHVYFEECYTGMTVATEEDGVLGQLIVNSYAQYYITNGGYTFEELIDAEFPYFAKIVGGVISFGSSPEAVICAFEGGDKLYYGNSNGTFRISLPGAKDYTLAVQSADCSHDGQIPFVATAGADVATLKVMCFGGAYTASDENVEFVATNADATVIESGKNYSFNLANEFEIQRYTFIVAALDADGNAVNGAATYTYTVNDNSDNWVSLGKVQYTDDILPSMYDDFVVSTYEVEIQEHATTPFYFRLVNPYGADTEYAVAGAECADHNHYLYIHAETPNKVWIAESPLGIDMGYGMMVVSTIVDDSAAELEEYAGYFGTRTEEEITFPVKTILASEKYYQDGAWFYANVNGAFSVKGAAVGAVDRISIEDADNNAPVEYFNLQGIRVDNPTSGLVIRRQGNTTTKVVL